MTRIRPGTVADVDAVVDMWVDLARSQRAHGSDLRGGENRAAIREQLLGRAVAGGLVVAVDDSGADSDPGGGSSRSDDPDGSTTGDGGSTADARDAGDRGEDGRIVGFVEFGRETGEFDRDDDRGHVSNLYVRPDRRGAGVGADLLAAAERQLAREGADAVVLEAMADNEAARRFYRRQGYDPHRVQLRRSLDGEAGGDEDPDPGGTDADRD